jgi:hypothetical protein
VLAVLEAAATQIAHDVGQDAAASLAWAAVRPGDITVIEHADGTASMSWPESPQETP